MSTIQTYIDSSTSQAAEMCIATPFVLRKNFDVTLSLSNQRALFMDNNSLQIIYYSTFVTSM